METRTGPCLAHCYRCPTSVVWASNASIVLTLAFACAAAATVRVDGEASRFLAPEHAVRYEAAQRRRAWMFAGGIMAGAAVVACWRPYTPLKLA